MSWVYPWVWWWTLALIAAMTLWHLLQHRPPNRVIPSTLLWLEVLPDQRAQRPWNPPQPWWLWVLRVLIVASMGAAAAGPYVPYVTAQASQIVIAVDRSASMATTTPEGRRDAVARRYAHALVDSLAPTQAITLLAFDRDVAVLTSRQYDRAYVHALIDSITPQAVAGSSQSIQAWVDLLPETTLQVFVISDDAALFAEQERQSWYAIPVGGAAVNQMIRGVRMTQTATEWQFTVQVAVDGASQPMTRRIEARTAQGALIDANVLTFDPLQPTEWQFSVTQPPDTMILSLDQTTSDALASDDTYVWQIAARQAVTVALQGGDAVFLPAALDILPNITRIADVDSADIVITDQALPSERPLSHALWLVNPLQGSSLVTPTAQVTLPTLMVPDIRSQAATLVRDVTFQQTQVLTASVLAPTYWAQPWLTSGAGAHAVAGLVDGFPVVVTGFDFRDTNMPLRPDFPLLIRNIVSFLTPPTVQTTWATGQVVPLGPVSQPRPVLAVQPDGATAEIAEVGDRYVLRNANHVGAYQISGQWYAFNIDSLAESYVNRPVVTVDIPLAYVGQSLNVATWMVIVALVLLVGERILMRQQRRYT